MGSDVDPDVCPDTSPRPDPAPGTTRLAGWGDVGPVPELDAPAIIVGVDAEDFTEAVLLIVERVPPGRVTTYGAIADAVGGGGPRRVGRVMSQFGGPVPWWRVVRSDGSLPACHDDEARAHYLEEATPVRGSGRIDLPRAFWQP